MARTSTFGFTNTSVSTNEVAAVALGLVDNYAVATDTADTAVLNNKTAPVDLEEIVTFRSRDIARVDNSLNIQYPSPVQKGIQYQVMVEDTLSTTDSEDASFRVDEPICAQLTIRHPKSGNITNDIVAAVVTRLLSTCIRADGSWRFDDMMRSAEKPIAN
jgi:hypothetical protein